MHPYFPLRHDNWEKRPPSEVGFDTQKFEAAIKYAEGLKTTLGRNISELSDLLQSDPPPWNKALGPLRDRGGRNGMVVKDGYIVAEWGDTNQFDMASSASKIFVNACAGLLHADGRLPDFDEPVARSVPGPWFSSAQNAPITWRMLLQQTSEWEGSVWDLPDQVDRNRSVLPSGAGRPRLGEDPVGNRQEFARAKALSPRHRTRPLRRAVKNLLGLPRASSRRGGARPLRYPGTYFEYNDVRINRLALSLTLLAGRALPSVLEEQLMDRIGASSTWQWLGYWNSWVDLNGTLVQAVSGGSHWGGGMYISSRDLARFGLLYCRRGRWELAQVLPSIFIERTFEPGPVNRNFGLLWWLNTDQKLFPTLPDTGACAYGFGSNILWIDPAVDLVVVARWYHGPSTGYLLDSIYRALAP